MNRIWRRKWLVLPLLLLLTSCVSLVRQQATLSSVAVTEGVFLSEQVSTAYRPQAAAALPPAEMLSLLDDLHEAVAEHADQAALLALVQAGQPDLAFSEAFHLGDELFETQFNALDGVGANVGQGLRFTQTPRADLDGAGEWATHFPMRITGPNAEACNQCHGTPFDDGAGRAINNNVRDPGHTGRADHFIVRNTPHVFGAGAIQVLAEEMTEELQAQQAAATARACADNQPVTVALTAKRVEFGQITVTPQNTTPCTVNVDTSAVVGVNGDLVVRPFQWKGVITSVRAFNRDASHQELGMQAVEIVGEGIDGDGDGVVNELTVGDQTALALYVAAQPRPTTRLELANLGLIEPLTAAEQAAVLHGSQHFHQIGCTHCHTPQLTLDDPIFYEPSRNPAYRDQQFPAGQDPVALGVDPAHAIAFDLTQDQPDNQLVMGQSAYHLGAFQRSADGSALIPLYGDLKRHDMGPDLAEMIDDEGIPAAVFLTENLWGVGSTAPYLHDGRATTLTEAILAHGGEGAASRAAFVDLPATDQAAVIAFLNNLVLFKLP
ncbi:MAG: di-heme oxidoredictase family protein [Caldilineaceae bacterium]